MKEIKKTQNRQNINNHAVNSVGDKPIVTLDDLKGIMPDIRRVKTPCVKELHQLQPILVKPLSDGGLWVYPNGFAMYKSGRRTSVLRIARAGSHTYEFLDGEKILSLNDQPWASALVLYGEGRIEQNTREWDARRNVRYDGFEDFDETGEPESKVVLAATDDVEGTVVDKLDNPTEKMLGCLTARQRQVVKMYYLQNLTQQAIADTLGISQRAISYVLDEAAARLKKPSRNFENYF